MRSSRASCSSPFALTWLGIWQIVIVRNCYFISPGPGILFCNFCPVDLWFACKSFRLLGTSAESESSAPGSKRLSFNWLNERCRRHCSVHSVSATIPTILLIPVTLCLWHRREYENLNLLHFNCLLQRASAGGGRRVSNIDKGWQSVRQFRQGAVSAVICPSERNPAICNPSPRWEEVRRWPG